VAFGSGKSPIARLPLNTLLTNVTLKFYSKCNFVTKFLSLTLSTYRVTFRPRWSSFTRWSWVALNVKCHIKNLSCLFVHV